MKNTERKPENVGQVHTTPIRFDDVTFQKVMAIAKKDDRSFSYVVRMAVTKYLEAVEKKNAATKVV